MDVKIKNLGKFKVLKNKSEISTGLRFSKKLKEKEGVILNMEKESKFLVDMLFVFFNLDLAFLNSKKEIVDIRRNVKPFISFITPNVKSKYLIEMSSSEMKNLKIGDKLEF